MTTQFEGETDWDAIINDNSLDIVEENDFMIFVYAMGESEESSLETLEFLFSRWEQSRE